MQKFFIRHKLITGDITHLSDSDSELVLNENKLNIEDVVHIETLDKKYLAQITDMENNSVEVEILEDLGERENPYQPDITIIQSLSNDSKFTFFIEKSVEIGIERIIPIESKYSLKTRNKALKDQGYWRKLVKDAKEQSRNIFPTIIDKPIRIKDLYEYNFPENSVLICLATENVEPMSLTDLQKEHDLKNRPVYIAIGPEKGWSSSDINVFKELGFEFIYLKGNILRTETTGLVIGSIIKYIKGEI
jgi:16S rRNA (uracil1498-N3)-methyltransferase